jgi:hypothetical protein
MSTGRSTSLPLPAAALIVGAALLYVDSRPGWDDTGVTVALLLIASCAFGFCGAERPWLYALAVGVWIPIGEFAAGWNPGSLLAPVLSFAGAYAGSTIRRLFLPPGGA